MLDRDTLGRRIDQGIGRQAADLVIKGARILNVATGTLDAGDIAICGDWIVGTYQDYRGRREIDGRGLIAAPGFIDTHVHVESSLVTPGEFDRQVLPRGTTTAICDPHEIANVLGVEGIRYFLGAAQTLRMTLKVQLSSCVPATDLETSGARLLVAPWPLFVGLERAYPFAHVHDEIRRFCLAAGIPHQELREAFAGRRTEELWVHPVDHHPNETAHRLAAEALAPVVLKLAP